ncbi:hypothetical protein C8Q78DRAFT_1039945 [Trametes maxima]|nr:hypothetical protein C8Q78DRAFT_1039945 [Trametes maxima]
MSKAKEHRAQTRNVVHKKGKELRNALYPNWSKNNITYPQFPTLQEKLQVYEQIHNLKLPGMAFYTRHRHLSWCSDKEKRLREKFSSPELAPMPQTRMGEAPSMSTATAWEVQTLAIQDFVRAQLAGTPDPTLSTLRDWAARSGTHIAVVFEAANRLQLELEAQQQQQQAVAVPNAPPPPPLVDGESSAAAAAYDQSIPAAPQFCEGGTWQGEYWAPTAFSGGGGGSGSRGTRSATPGTYAGSSTAYSPAGAPDGDWDVAPEDAVTRAAFEVEPGYNWGTPGYADYCTY